MLHSITVEKVTGLCEWDRQDISCPSGKTIRVLEASYGRHDTTTCHNFSATDTNCHAEGSLAAVQNICDNNARCQLFSDNSVFGDPCPGVRKYLEVTYYCASSY
ncbi:hypothetical protein OS493_005668 [Desmophyllum pertusum]|uniref:SUEL-type lectin domain-containing protein n=1 Tax=Desmophyllum pertusum TaxID=174260 RepID=A0A9W9YSN9_9CNID|nr:hypothetical protein OS493_005668 [Desmophyllum pertusum]